MYPPAGSPPTAAKGTPAPDAAARVLAALNEAGRHGPDATLDRALNAVREEVSADLALVLRRADPLTAVTVGSTPREVVPGGVTTAAVFAGALDRGYAIYRSSNEPMSAIPAALRGAVAILPFPKESGVDGAVVLVRRSGAPFSESEQRFLEGTLGLLLALTHLRLTSLRSEEFRARFDAIVQTLPHGLVFMDGSGAEAWVNGAASALLGLSQGTVEPFLVSRAMAALRTRADDRGEIERRTRDVLSRPKAELRDARWVFSGPPRRALSVSSTSTSGWRSPGRLWLFIDVTAQHFAQEELMAKNAALEDARREADLANAAKSRFLATMSHEIRTPMNGVLGMAALLLGTRLDSEQRDFVETIRASGDALLTIINDILDFSKIEAGLFELERQPFRLRPCIEEALDLLVVSASKKGLDLGVILSPEVPSMIHGDAPRLRQIIVNLVGNAVKFTDKGEISVEVSLAPSSPQARREGELMLHFQVRDTGIGIPKDRIDRLFQSFSQVDASTSRKYGGTGLGLAISRKLAELMGGKMWVESAEGVGSTFHFTIAQRPSPSVDDEEEAAMLAGAQSLAGMKVLVAEDSAQNRRVLELQLRSWGVEPVLASSGMEALTLLRKAGPFSLVLIDRRMPVMDGFMLAGAIRSDPAFHKLPLLMIASAVDRTTREEAARLGAGCLTKPIKQSMLFDAMMTAVAAPGALASRRPHTASPTLDPTLGERLPLRILLAEDAAINQKVALLLLSRLGYRADVANNGYEVLEALARTPYDLIFMDVQMPHMDGLEATRRLLAHPPLGGRPRIVAMTANVTQSDRELCREAGMEDFVDKPIQAKDLVSALHRAAVARAELDTAPTSILVPASLASPFLMADEAASPPEAKPEPPAYEGDKPKAEDAEVRTSPSTFPSTFPPTFPPTLEGEVPVLDADEFERLRSLLGPDEPAELASLVGEYLERARALVADMQSGIAEGDRETVERAAHTLKGSSAIFAATRLSRRCDALSRAAREGPIMEEVYKQFEEIQKDLVEAERALSEALG